MRCRLKRALTSAPTPGIEDKDPAPQFASLTSADNPFGSAALWLCYSMWDPNSQSNSRKLTFSGNKFTVMKIHNSFDLLFQDVSTIDRDKWMYLHLTWIMDKKRDLPKYLFMPVLSFSCVNDFGRFSGLLTSPSEAELHSSFSSRLAEMFNPSSSRTAPVTIVASAKGW